MNKNKNKKLFKSIIIVLIICLIITATTVITEKYIINRRQIKISNMNITEDKAKIINCENNQMTIEIDRVNGVKKIQMPNGMEINCENKNTVAVDYDIEENNEYNFTVTDIDDNVTEEKFIAPSLHMELVENTKIDLLDTKEKLKESFMDQKVATNFMTIGIGNESTIDSNTDDMQTIFNNWTKFGDGNWGYNKANNWIYNTKNSNYITGYYAPNEQYDEIELEFEALTKDSDDDMIGAMIRFNAEPNSNFSSYLFLLDSHDSSGKGIDNGAWNGLNKVINNKLQSTSTITKLNNNSSLRWTRNVWQKYKLTAKGDLIEAYIDDNKIASIVDDSIREGSYGFLAYSQAYTYYRELKVKCNKENEMEDIFSEITWETEGSKYIINFSNTNNEYLTNGSVTEGFNQNDVTYVGVGTDTNKQEILDFIESLDTKNGTFIQNDENSIENICKFIIQKYRNM